MILYNLQVEQAILGSCLLDPEALNKTYEDIKVEDFYSTEHQIIYKAMTELVKENIAVDLITLSDYLKNHAKLDTIGGYSKLTQLMNTIPISQNIDYYNQILKAKSKQRK
ncbi:MAG TPA: replicative DNA helicase, partial [Candidatus Atribacteria bacterium]|nr:replicative DNA helicase [Candidatus Atribacteria bacterium]